MPTYEYECKKCERTFEIFQSMKDEPLKICPQCGCHIKRLINGGSGIIFKGSGFYSTDKQTGTKTSADKLEKKGNKAESPASKTEQPVEKKEKKAAG